MEDKKVIILEGENHTIKSISELADKENVKVVIVGAGTDIEKHAKTIQKFAVTGYILVATAQLAIADRKRVEEGFKTDPFKADLSESLIQRIKKTAMELELLPEPMVYEHKQEFRKVKHTQAKPVKQFNRPVKNHHFKRK